MYQVANLIIIRHLPLSTCTDRSLDAIAIALEAEIQTEASHQFRSGKSGAFGFTLVRRLNPLDVLAIEANAFKEGNRRSNFSGLSRPYERVQGVLASLVASCLEEMSNTRAPLVFVVSYAYGLCNSQSKGQMEMNE